MANDIFSLLGVVLLLLVLAATCGYLFWIAKQTASSAAEAVARCRTVTSALRQSQENRENLAGELQQKNQQIEKLEAEVSRLINLNDNYKRQIERSAEKKEA